MRGNFIKIVGLASVLFAAGTMPGKAASLEDLLGVSGDVFAKRSEKSESQDGSVINMRFETIKAESENGSQNKDAVEFRVSVTLAGHDKEMSASGQCARDEESGMVDCRVDCDGSGFLLQSAGKRSLMLLNPEGFSVGCSKTGKAVMVKPDRENSAYELKGLDKEG